jgi:hypothetical protein
MPFTMRNKSQFSRLQLTSLDSLDDDPAPTRGDDVKHQAMFQLRKHEAPRRPELGVGVEGTAHSQEMEHLAHAIDRRPGIGHHVKYVREATRASSTLSTLIQ